MLKEAEEFANLNGSILNLQEAIQSQSPRMALAAEFKRASPSKGDIAPDLNAGEQALKYATAGANIISVLTDQRWFKGTIDDMKEARLQSTTATQQQRPAILRKDFVINEYMIAEAAAKGADTILLIVAILPAQLLKRLIDYSRKLGMEPLVEVHAHEEVDVALSAGAKVIGVNNRNLHTFQMDMSNTEKVADMLRARGLVFDHDSAAAAYTLCSLSGMSTALDVDRYRQIGVGMCLIGESLMRATDPGQAISDLCLDPTDFARQSSAGMGGAYTRGTRIVKVCGVTNAEDALVACRAGANMIGVIFVPKSKRCATVEQGKEVVEAVRAFGERRQAMILPEVDQAEPVPHLVGASRALEEATKRPVVVGVFQNQEPSFIQSVVQECGLDMVQLHGKEGMEAANTKNTGAPTIRVVDVETDAETGKAVSSAVEDVLDNLTADPAAILLDTSIKGSRDGGGTGVTFDWNIAERMQDAGLPVIIAGGLNPENVKDAVGSVRPWGVDISSGVEASPGKKDHQKVQDFVKNARSAAMEASKGF